MKNKLPVSRHTLLLAGIFVLCAAVLFIALPDNSVAKYEYDVGKLWNYDALVASVDIEIFNEPDKQKAIEDSMKRELKPIYYRNNDVASQVVDAYSAALNRPDMADIRHRRNSILNALRDIYRTGVIDSRGTALPQNVGMRISENEVRNAEATSFYTFASAHARMREILGSDTTIHHLLSGSQFGIRPNILFDSAMNAKAESDIKTFAHAAIGRIPGGTKIVDRGDLITPRIYNILQTYEKKALTDEGHSSKVRFVSNLGTILIIVLAFGALYFYLAKFRADYFSDIRIVALLSIMVTSFILFAFAMNGSFEHGIYMVPFTIVPIVLLVFLDSRTAFYTYMVTLILCAALTHYMWDFIFMQFVAGFIGLITIRELSRRSQLISAALWIFLSYSVAYIGVDLMQTGRFDSISTSMFGALAINGIFISFAYILIFLIEKCFGLTSRVTLVELSDINNPLLRELSEECPGTFQHSMAVSNIAAAAANRIGANVQLVRAGALYHDIGKMSNPAFFTENQHGINPHNALSPIQSARIVIGHVKEGVKRAEKAKIPMALRNFILEHHGKGKARYFYTTYCNEHPDEKVDESLFTYPGPNPQSIETSILMMADAVEAASRSLKDHSAKSISELVDRIIDSQVKEGLHNDSPISFRDITEIKRSFASSLRTMYHSRISYPDAVKPAEKPEESDN